MLIQRWRNSVMTPEQTAREQMDAQLGRCGWTVQTRDKIKLSASPGVFAFITSKLYVPVGPCRNSKRTG
jgi:hypothetical protein